MPPLLKLYLDTLQKWEILSPFVLLYGPGADEQWKAVQEVSQEVTWFFAPQDIVELKDFGSELGKTHTLKVEYKKNNTISKTLESDYWYQDIGSREVNERLSLSPAGDLKILLVEHIERANGAAANALLKSFEEPLPKRAIIASTKNKDSVIDTILSRALLIHCDHNYTQPELNDEQKEIFATITDALENKNIAQISKLAASIGKWDRLPDFFEALLYHYYSLEKFVAIPAIIEAIQYRTSNVSGEHVVFQLCLQLLEK